MPKTAYCQVEPIKSALDSERDAFTLEEELEVEGFLQQWGRCVIDPGHVYADDGHQYQILARNLTVSPRLMVAFHDKFAPKTTVTAVSNGADRNALDTAYAFGGKTRTTLPPVMWWRP